MFMREKGFTLIELVIVILIIGILAVVISTDIASFMTISKLEAARFKLKSDIIYAQNLAVSQQINYRVTFSIAPTNSYTVFQGPATNIPDPLTGTVPFTVNFSTNPSFQGVMISSTNLSFSFVEFDELGVPADGLGNLTGDGTITLTYGGSTAVITITKNTGKVN